jgi:hypothetical protein
VCAKIAESVDDVVVGGIGERFDRVGGGERGLCAAAMTLLR